MSEGYVENGVSYFTIVSYCVVRELWRRFGIGAVREARWYTQGEALSLPLRIIPAIIITCELTHLLLLISKKTMEPYYLSVSLIRRESSYLRQVHDPNTCFLSHLNAVKRNFKSNFKGNHIWASVSLEESPFDLKAFFWPVIWWSNRDRKSQQEREVRITEPSTELNLAMSAIGSILAWYSSQSVDPDLLIIELSLCGGAMGILAEWTS
ncbi:hypothetical protein Tco_1361553 [Tanacetum coccineum]